MPETRAVPAGVYLDLQHPALFFQSRRRTGGVSASHFTWLQRVAELLQVEGDVLTAEGARDVVPVSEQLHAVNRLLALLAPLAGEILQPPLDRNRQRPAGAQPP